MIKKITVAVSALLLFGSASSPYGNRPWDGAYSPVFIERSELERSVSYRDGGRSPVNPGKIYYRAPYIFINERYRGIHVINNSDPSHPVNEGFIVAPGCTDMAMKGDILYIDNAVDLVAFDFAAKTVTERIRNVLPEPAAPDKSVYYGSRPRDFVLAGWEKVTARNPE
ncbi:MAG: hypothetical protein LBK07_00635 [Tannerella sp.]|jgi:hypothetical protein|nr:hypothetical protein [Tannerella sp.]